MTYTYKCKGECGKLEDKVHGMTETPVIKCCDVPMKKWFGTAPLGIHGANTGKRTGT